MDKNEVLREELRKLKGHVESDVRPVESDVRPVESDVRPVESDVRLDEETRNISFSAYKVDDPLYENNHVALCEVRGGKVNKHSSVMSIVRNVLSDCGISVVEDL